MPLTNAQTVAFFTNGAQMGIPANTFAQLENEGITTPNDLIDFDDTALKQLAENLRRPGGQVPIDPADPAAGMVNTPPFVFGAKSQKRLSVACNLVRFYETIGRPLTAANLQWTPVMRNFEVQWNSLMQRKEEDRPETPKITRSLPILKWIPAFQDHCSRIIGVRNVPLSYVLRRSADVPAAVPALAPDQPHTAEHGSVEADLVERASHTHPAFSDDNKEVYYLIEEATRGTMYATSIRPFTRTKNGRGCMEAITSQFAGKDKWIQEQRKADELLHNRKWKGTGNFTLEHFIAQHRNAYMTLTASREHNNYQLPLGRTRVQYLINAIETSDAQLLTAIEAVRGDEEADGKGENFEKAAAHLMPACPVARKRGKKRPVGDISDVQAGETVKTKLGIGSTGVHLRYHTKAEYAKLNDEQRSELWQYRKSNPDEFDTKKRPRGGKEKGKSPSTRMTKKQVSKLLAKEVGKLKEAMTVQAPQADEQYLLSLVDARIAQSRPTTPTPPAPTPSVAATQTPPTTDSSLRSILRRVCNSGP